ncbi:ring-hydroxylating dioxygenase, large terminal subunit [Caulobacter sp. AP07]|uniref:aromatic ring-hydroxylating oxygenase subunit alpha n=1 Tax=Caulobacter sp. AP07 TaxID=1144304 RepID=UPI000271EDDC|nr:aromatic ring-hydroxylating dioxygenase subunit alpha [Caulobacter sp. AP07]EJL30804.1 ring-hydroxylating dioxygenase, large terminal subunit [Caulobacter sp. AP07]
MTTLIQQQRPATDAASHHNSLGGVARAAFDAVMKPFEIARVLPPRCYTDPDFHRFEVEKVLTREWIYAGRVDQVANPGDYFTLRRFDETVIIMRDHKGGIKAFSAACRHRGYPVASGAGNCGKKGFVCPYHGWRYRTDGTLAAAPYMQEGYSPEGESLPEFAVDVWQGFVFFNFDRDAEPLSPRLKTLDAVLEPFGLASMKCSTMREKAWPGNWKATLDNFTEAYHQPYVHPTTFEPMAPARKGIYEDVDGPYNLFWLPAPDGGSIDTFFDPVPGLPERHANAFIVVNVFPMFHMLIDPCSVVILDMDVHSVDRLTARWDILVTEASYDRPDFAAVRDAYTAALVPTWDEDELACETVRQGQSSRFAEQGNYSWMEKSVHQFHTWLAERYTAQA